jgi:membrane protease YdiL (CAAX protease family)
MIESAEPRPAWPPWYGIAGLFLALVITTFGGALLLALLGVNSDDNGVNIVLTLILDAALVGCALWLAAHVAPPRAWQFGLRSVPLKRGLKWGAIAFAIYFVFQIVYALAVEPESQTTLEDLGAGESAALTALIGVMVVGVAPVAEEFFFRGFFYGALRTRLPFVAAALLDGLVFGGVHASTGPEAVPPLMMLGFAFCLAYEATGSIIPGIVLHALNHMVAFGADKDGSWAVGAITAVVVVTACVTLPGHRSRTLQ